MGFRVILPSHELCVQTRCVAGVTHNFLQSRCNNHVWLYRGWIPKRLVVVLAGKSSSELSFVGHVKITKHTNTMEFSRICNSKGIALKEEGISNEVLKLSPTELENAKWIHHAKQKRWSEDKAIYFLFCLSRIISISYPVSLNPSNIKQCQGCVEGKSQ